MASVDVIVPCYQYGRYLRDCVASVLSQEIQDLHVLIIDNASTDNSIQVARELSFEDSRIQVLAHRINLGHHASFNEGIDWASSDYFMILCADDRLAPGCLRRAVSIMEQHRDVVFAYGRMRIISSSEPIPFIKHRTQDESWRILSGRRLLERFCLTGQGLTGRIVLMRTAAQKKAGHYRRGLLHMDDFEMWMRLACLGDVAETGAVQGVVRSDPTNRSADLSNPLMWDLECEAAFHSFFANEGASAPAAKGLHRIASRNLAERAYWGGLANLLRGHGRLGLSLLRFAFRRRPTMIILPPLTHLLRRDDALSKITHVFSELARRVRIPISHRQAAS